ncbi:MAG: RNA methyltransferase [Chitinophagaceae bacterium]
MLSKSRVKYIQSLGHKKFRDEEGLYIAEGPKIVNELIKEIPDRIDTVYALKSWLDENKVLSGKIESTEITTIELEKISQLSIPNSVLAIIKKNEEPVIETQNRITIVLDTIQDPGNLGTIIRTADWFGINQVVCSNDSADNYNPKVVQATMGSIARVKVLYTDLPLWLVKQNVNIYAAALNGKDITALGKLKEGIIIIGNESKGISGEIMKLANEKITISRKGKAESLNAAVAAGIIMSAII